MTNDPIDAAESGLDAVMTETFGIKKGGLAEKIRRAARRMPRGAKRAAEEDLAYLDAARKRTAHPRRRGLVDRARLERMETDHRKRLGKVDVARDKARERLNWLGGLVLNLMLFGVVYYALLKWLGAI